MALTFTTNLDNQNLLFAINNNVIEFYSDSTELPLNCEIQIGTQPSRIVYPMPNGSFWFNFKEYILDVFSIIGDDYDYTPTEIKDETAKIFNNETISITITFLDDSTETSTYNLVDWLYATTDKRLYKNELIPRNKVTPLTPQNKIADNVSYLKYWVGYPMSYTLFNGLGDDSFYFKEKDGFAQIDPIDIEYSKIMRVPLCDGTNGSTQYLFAGIEIRKVSDDSLLHLITVDIDYTPCSGYYIKWKNRFGDWNHWLFQNGGEQLKTKELGEINKNFNNLNQATTLLSQIGKSAFNTFTVTTDLINENESLLLSDLFESPKIYLWTGETGTATTEFDWIEINLTTNTINTILPKTTQNQINLTFELPPKDTRTL